MPTLLEKTFRWSATKTLALVIFATLALLAWAFIVEARVILSQPINSWTEDATADCAVVLTGGPARIREGLDLLARKSVQKLIISGVHPHAEYREIFPLWIYYGDIKAEDVILERRSRTTYGNAQQSFPLVEALGCRDVVLITSRVHMRRAIGTFRAEFPPDFPLIPRAVTWGTTRPGWIELATETAKSLFYSLWAY